VSQGLRLAVAIGAGLIVLVVLALVAALSDALRFAPLCAWTGVALLALALLSQLALASPHVGEQPSALRPLAHEERVPVTGPAAAERRSALRSSLYLSIVAAPCLIAAAIAYLG